MPQQGTLHLIRKDLLNGRPAKVTSAANSEGVEKATTHKIKRFGCELV